MTRVREPERCMCVERAFRVPRARGRAGIHRVDIYIINGRHYSLSTMREHFLLLYCLGAVRSLRGCVSRDVELSRVGSRMSNESV